MFDEGGRCAPGEVLPPSADGERLLRDGCCEDGVRLTPPAPKRSPVPSDFEFLSGLGGSLGMVIISDASSGAHECCTSAEGALCFLYAVPVKSSLR